MARTKKTCDNNCFECKHSDCIKPLTEISITERLESRMRDNECQTYGTVIPAKRQRKDRGRRT